MYSYSFIRCNSKEKSIVGFFEQTLSTLISFCTLSMPAKLCVLHNVPLIISYLSLFSSLCFFISLLYFLLFFECHRSISAAIDHFKSNKHHKNAGFITPHSILDISKTNMKSSFFSNSHCSKTSQSLNN